MKKNFLTNSKSLTLTQAIEKRSFLKQQGLTLAITNGCFDLLHTGHLYYLQQAAQQADVFWVLLNSSASIRQLKGPTRPIQEEMDRAYALGALACVDAIILFDTPRLTEEILALQPDVYVKAGDYTLETLDAEERTALKSVGAQICFMPFLPGYSTSNLIAKIKES